MPMHVHTVRTKYTFGDRVRYASRHNGSGTGTIIGIVFHETPDYYYYIEIDGSREIAGGIMDDDITPLPDDPDVSAPVRV
jgi:hypothetical protein